MFKPLSTALVIGVLVVAVGAGADAKSRAEGPAIATAILSPDAAPQAVDATGEFAVPAAARRQLLASQSDGNMPAAGADLVMWGASGTNGSRSAAKHSDPINRFARGIVNRTSSIAMSLTRSAMRFIGTPYVFGGTSASGFDCSGYVQHVFAMLGIALPRTADAQYYAGHPAIGGLHRGDLVFFQTYLPGPSHVGIYISNGKFIASSGHGVMVSRLSDRYWAARYIGAKRILALRR